MKHKLLSFTGALLMSISPWAAGLSQESSDDLYPPSPVKPSYYMSWVQPEDGGVYYLYNVGCDQFLGIGNNWGTKAVVKSISDSEPPIYWDENTFIWGEDTKGNGFVVPIKLNKSGNYYTIQHLGTNKLRNYLHSWGDDSWFNTGEGELFDIQRTQDGYTLALQGQTDSYLSVPKQRDEDQIDVCDVHTNRNAENDYIVWRFARTNYKEWQLYTSRNDLYNLLKVALNLGADVEEQKNIYLDQSSTLENLQSAIKQTQIIINHYKGEEWKQIANDSSPIDLTDECLKNPSLDSENADGWVLTYSGAIENAGYQSAGYTNGDVQIQGFIEMWQQRSDPYVLGNVSLQQTVYGLPGGKYVLEADAISVFQYTDIISGNNPTKGSYLFLKSKKEARQPLATDTEKPEHFSVSLYHDGSDELSLGIKTINTTANWVAADNFKLLYYGPADLCTFNLKVSGKGEVIFENTTMRSTAKNLTASSNHGIELILKPDFAYVVSKVLKDGLDITQDIVDNRILINDISENCQIQVEFGQDRSAAYAAYESVKEKPMRGSILSNLERYKERLDTTYTSEALSSFYIALNNAYTCVLAYAKAAEILKSKKKLVESTNFYSNANYKTYYGLPQEKYDLRTMTTAEADAQIDPFIVVSYDNRDPKLSSLLIGPWATSASGSANWQVNTWSTEGDSDGTNFHVPFIEYWISDDTSLPGNTLTGVIRDVQAGTYDVSVLVRTKVKNGVSSPPTGITFYANESEPINVANGERISDSQYYLAEYHVICQVGNDGTLRVNFKIASNNNINWLAFKNIKYTKIDESALAGNPVKEGNFYLYNVGAKQWLCAGGRYGLQASLTPIGGLDVDLHHTEDDKYSIHTGYPNFYANENEDEYLSYWSNDDIGCNGAEYGWTFTQMSDLPYTYLISHENGNLAFDGKTKQLRITSEKSANALWILVSHADRISALTTATPDNPRDATFLIKDANFGIDDPRSTAWVGLKDNSHILWDDNGCAEVRNQTFDVHQTIHSVPNGTYSLKAQGVYVASKDQNNAPFFYINNHQRDFLFVQNEDYTKYDFTTAFLYGYYSAGSIGCHVIENTLNIGAKLISYTGYWCLWDNFELMYYGTADIASSVSDSTTTLPPTRSKYIEIAHNASPTNPIDLTSFAIINPEYEWSTQGWQMDIEATNVQYQDDQYQNGTYIIGGFAEAWNEQPQHLANGYIRQLIRNLPQGEYRLEVDAIAVQQADDSKNAKGVYLFASSSSLAAGVSIPIYSKNEQPEHFILTFEKKNNNPLNIGIRTINTDANWIAVDNWKLSCIQLYDSSATTFTAKSYTREYGEENPIFEYTWDGAEPNGTPVITCDATKTSPVGTYDIKISRGSVTNTNDSYIQGTLTITKAPLSIKTDDQKVEYGEKNPNFTVTYDGFKNGETETVLAIRPKIQCSGKDVGRYQIIALGAVAQNYEITYYNGTLTITPAPLTAKAKDVSRYEGEANPALEIEYKGWKLNEDESVLTAKPVAQTDADEKSRPGEYEIKVTGGTAKNYTLQLVSGTLTVLEIPSHLIQYDGMSFYIPNTQYHEVTLTKVDEKAHVVVPSSVMYREQEWTIRGIADSVFAGHTVLTTVEIPSTVTRVGKDVFDRCPHLAAIVWRSPQKMTKGMMGNFSNPNLLLYLTTKATMLDGVTNLVDLSTMRAERIVLTDNGGTNDFYCPMAFTADEITYSHVYQQQTHAGSSQGWETLSLPFDVTTVTHKEKGLIHPFATLTDTDIIGGERPFWLYEYAADGFKEADKIVANTPYIISMPNEATLWEGFILKGQVTFQATNASVRATADAAEVSGGERSFRSNFSNNDGAGLYMLNVSEEWNGHAEGSVFVQSLRAAHPFEACFTSASGVKAFNIDDSMTDGIREMNLPETWRPANSDAAVYDLSGRKMTVGKGKEGTLRRGMYIVDGKKYIKR